MKDVKHPDQLPDVTVRKFTAEALRDMFASEDSIAVDNKLKKPIRNHHSMHPKYQKETKPKLSSPFGTLLQAKPNKKG